MSNESIVDSGAAAQTGAVADEVLLNAVDAARTALYEITPPSTVGAPAGHLVEGERVLSLLFENRLPGYPGWYWTVSLSREPDSSEVNVLEAELMPGDGALLAPDWVPWADRLAEYQAQKRAEREAAAAAGELEPEDEDEDDFLTDADEDDADEDDIDEVDDDDLEVEEPDDEDDSNDDFESDDDDSDDDFDEAADLQDVETAALSADDED